MSSPYIAIRQAADSTLMSAWWILSRRPSSPKSWRPNRTHHEYGPGEIGFQAKVRKQRGAEEQVRRILSLSRRETTMLSMVQRHMPASSRPGQARRLPDFVRRAVCGQIKTLRRRDGLQSDTAPVCG